MQQSTSGMKLITLYLPMPLIKELDELVENNYYPSRAEAIRFAVRDLLKYHRKETHAF